MYTPHWTGYIGGSVLARLLELPDSKSFHITALVRSTEKAEKLRTLGLNTILGSYSDNHLGFLTEAAANADLVFTIARFSAALLVRVNWVNYFSHIRPTQTMQLLPELS